MASTQQLCRIDQWTLQQCIDDVDMLHSVISYKLSKAWYLDLNWFLVYFKRLIKHLDAPLDFQNAITICINGGVLVNEKFPYFEVDEPPRYIDQHRVSEIRYELDCNLFSCVKAQSFNVHELNDIMSSDFDTNPLVYFEELYGQLAGFVSDAAMNKQALITWWD